MFITLLNLVLPVRINECQNYFMCFPVIKMFGATVGFVLRFFGELFLLFLISALISYILRIDKASKE